MMTKKAIFESLGLFVLYLLVQVCVYFGMIAVFEMEIGSLLAWATCVTAIIMTVLLFACAKLRGRTIVYFGKWKIGNGKDWLISFGLLVLFWTVSELLGMWFDKSPMAFVDELLATDSFWFLLFVVVIVAPIYEEILFRGAIFGRLYIQDADHAIKAPIVKDSYFWQASTISAVCFALVHMQYDWFGCAMIVGLAFILAWAKAKTGSLVLPIALHITNNAVAMMSYFMTKS